MTESEANDITQAMRGWAKGHPSPNEPMLFLAGESYSPMQLASEVAARTPVGLLQLQVFDFAIKSEVEDVKSILEGLGADQQRSQDSKKE
jgi:hypothetical protein